MWGLFASEEEKALKIRLYRNLVEMTVETKSLIKKVILIKLLKSIR